MKNGPKSSKRGGVEHKFVNLEEYIYIYICLVSLGILQKQFKVQTC